jgi:hypothetical protein
MISPASDDFNDQVAELERYLDELERRTYSNFTVTNPSTGVKNLEVGPSGSGYKVTLRDSNGNTIWGNRSDVGITGFRMPLPMYPSLAIAGSGAVDTTWVDMWSCTTFVNSKNVQVAYRYQDIAPSGGTSECRVQYDAGAGRVTMTGSTVSAVNAAGAFGFSFPWPSDYFDTEIMIVLQGRISSGVGGLLVSPMYVLGG